MTDKLKPCPFCGATPQKGLAKIKHDQLHGEPYQDVIIKCPHLCASMEGSAEGVLGRWNARADDPRIAELEAASRAPHLQAYWAKRLAVINSQRAELEKALHRIANHAQTDLVKYIQEVDAIACDALDGVDQ